MYMKFKTIWIESKKQPGKESTRKGLTPFTLIAVCQQGRLAIDNYQNNFGLFILEKKKKKKRKQNRIIYTVKYLNMKTVIVIAAVLVNKGEKKDFR